MRHSWPFAPPLSAPLVGDHIEELCSVTDGSLADRSHVAYRLRVRNDDGEFLVEQQAYYAVDDGMITWMRVLCSGYRAAAGTAG